MENCVQKCITNGKSHPYTREKEVHTREKQEADNVWHSGLINDLSVQSINKIDVGLIPSAVRWCKILWHSHDPQVPFNLIQCIILEHKLHNNMDDGSVHATSITAEARSSAGREKMMTKVSLYFCFPHHLED